MSRRKQLGTAIPRLQQDYLNLHRDPVPYIRAEPLPSDMLEWHYVIEGPADTPYHGGYYYGLLLFTPQYPFKPPAIQMLTPNGRFETNRRLCISISDYHPETWNPTWSVSSILTGLLSFMLENAVALGTIETTDAQKRRFMQQSLAWNLRQEHFRTLFPELSAELDEKLRLQQEELQRRKAAEAAAVAAAGGGGGVGGAIAEGRTEAEGRRLGGDGGGESEDWTTLLNNVMLLVFTGLMGIIGYHVFGIMSAE